ncbi:uncharacterized protein ACMZJ9_006760 [Mantella aurantiaca]
MQGKNISWALACIQGQSELSTNIKLIVQSLYEGRWPYELASQLSKILPRHITFTNSKWWSNAWLGCTSPNYESCYASSLIPYTESHIGAVYSVISIGLLTGESTLLHPRLGYQNATNVMLMMEPGCSMETWVARGAWCTLGNVSEIQTQEWSYVVPSIANLSMNVDYRSPVSLGTMNLSMGSQLQDWLADWDGDESLLRKLQQERANATIVIYHDQNKIKDVVHQLENDAGGYWWEVIFGHSSKASGVLNYMIHPIVVLLILAVVLSLVQIYMCCWTRNLYKKISYLSMKVEGRLIETSLHSKWSV